MSNKFINQPYYIGDNYNSPPKNSSLEQRIQKLEYQAANSIAYSYQACGRYLNTNNTRIIFLCSDCLKAIKLLSIKLNKTKFLK